MSEEWEDTAAALLHLRDAVCRPGVPYPTENGGSIGDATEALIGMMEAIDHVADALHEVASAISENGSD